MARKYSNPPVRGGVRRRRTTTPKMAGNGDSTQISYSTPGGSVATNGAVPVAGWSRLYIGGNADGLTSAVGPNIVRNYMTYKYLPGTKVRWEPSVSFSTPGRVYACFVDNPEMISALRDALDTFNATPSIANYNNYVNGVRSVGNCVSFPVWQETDIPFYSSLRRKRFDTNGSSLTDSNVLDRCCQCALFCAVDGVGVANLPVGNIQYHDHLEVAGVSAIIT